MRMQPVLYRASPSDPIQRGFVLDASPLKKTLDIVIFPYGRSVVLIAMPFEVVEDLDEAKVSEGIAYVQASPVEALTQRIAELEERVAELEGEAE